MSLIHSVIDFLNPIEPIQYALDSLGIKVEAGPAENAFAPYKVTPIKAAKKHKDVVGGGHGGKKGKVAGAGGPGGKPPNKIQMIIAIAILVFVLSMALAVCSVAYGEVFGKTNNDKALEMYAALFGIATPTYAVLKWLYNKVK